MSTVEQQGKVPEKLAKIPMAELTSCPHEVFAKLRETSPAVLVESGGYRYWVITRYDDVRRLLADPSLRRDRDKYRDAVKSARVKGTEARIPNVPRALRMSPFYDVDERYHQLRAPWRNTSFSPRKGQELAGKVRDFALELLDTFQPGRPIDFLADYARPIVGKALCVIAGIPENERNMQAALDTDWLLTPHRSKVEASARSLADWATELVEIKRQGPGDDVLTSLLRLYDEGVITHDELTSSYLLIFLGGVEVATAAGNGAFTFLTHPGQLAKALAQPNLFDSCVDELVRWETQFRFVPPRITTQPVHLDGVTIPAGEVLLLCVGAANRDPSHFDDPDTFDVTRTATGHLGFGRGHHRCPGAQLSRTEVAIMLRLFFERFPETTLVDPPDQAQWQPGKFKRKLEALPVIPA